MLINSFLFKRNDTVNDCSPILMVSAADLKEVIRGIFEEVVSAKEGEKDETLLSIRQASALLGVDRTTLWRWEKEKYLVPIRFGSRVRYKQSDIERLCSK